MATKTKQATKTTRKPAPRKQRPYSMEYTAQNVDSAQRYLLSGIPPTMWRKFKARARREHVAMRQVILRAVEAWTNRPEGDPAGD